LFNTVVLLRSGITLTWAHNSLLLKRSTLVRIGATVLLATMFEVAQYVEYREATFSIADRIYGRIFYLRTGTHGIHVLAGHIFIIFNIIRRHLGHFTRLHHLRFTFCVWYWHFVDVVWLFLFVFVYWWGH
jgi:heme/copper-type cytochrome/quinol oxidase subunit 3